MREDVAFRIGNCFRIGKQNCYPRFSRLLYGAHNPKVVIPSSHPKQNMPVHLTDQEYRVPHQSFFLLKSRNRKPEKFQSHLEKSVWFFNSQYKWKARIFKPADSLKEEVKNEQIIGLRRIRIIQGTKENIFKIP